MIDSYPSVLWITRRGQLWILDAHFMEGWFVEIFMTIPRPHSSTLCSDDQASNARGGKGQVILSVCRREGVLLELT